VLADLAEVLLLVIRGALLAGLCWGAWLGLGERVRTPQAGNNRPLERFATFAVLILLLTAIGGLPPAS
jgi:hypothetical protein